MWDELYLAWAKWDFLRRIRKYGWTGNYIPGTDSEASFAYSIGLWECLGSPELIVFGADPALSRGLIGEAYARLKAGELKLADKAPWILDWKSGPRLAWRAVHPSQIRGEYFSVAIWYRQHRKMNRAGFHAFQLFMSDNNGVMPWEYGFDASHRPQQPELYLPYFGHAGRRTRRLQANRRATAAPSRRSAPRRSR